MKTLLASLVFAVVAAFAVAPAQSAPLAQTRAIQADVASEVTQVHRYKRRYYRHYGYRHHYRPYYYRPYAYYPRYYRPYYYPRYRSHSGFSFYIGPRYRHAYFYH